MSLFEIRYEPNVCKPKLNDKGDVISAAKFSGTVTIRMPTFIERQELINHGGMLDEKIAAIAAKVALDGEKVDEESVRIAVAEQAVKHQRELLMRVCSRLGQFTVAVDLTRLEDGYKFTTLEELMHDGDTDGVVVEMARKVIQKFTVGKTNSAK